MSRLKFFAPLVIALALIYVAYLVFSPKTSFNDLSNQTLSVSVAEVIESEVQEWNEFSGWLVAIDQVDVRPLVSGPIDKVHFNNGALVKKGDLLFTIDPRPYEATLEAARARVSLAESNIARAEKLMVDNAIPQREYDQRKNDLEVSSAELTRAQLDLEYTQVRSPIDGRVSRAEVTLGNIVVAGPGAPILTNVVSTHPIYADFDVDETTFLEYTKVDKESLVNIPVLLGLADEKDIIRKGRLEAFDNRLNNATGTIRVRAIFPNEDSYLIPGLFARIKLGTEGLKKRLLISERAVGTDQASKYVFVVDVNDKVAYRKVVLGGRSDGLRIVKEGLQGREKIIVKGLQRVRPGQQVKVEMVPMETMEVPSKNGKPVS